MRHLAEEILWDFITEDLERRERVEVESHLKECADCMQNYQSALALHKDLFALDHEQPSLSFTNSVLTRIEHETSLQKSNNFWFVFTKVVIIGALILAIVSVLVLLDTQKENIIVDENAFGISMQILLGVCLLWAFYGLDRLLKAYMPITPSRL